MADATRHIRVRRLDDIKIVTFDRLVEEVHNEQFLIDIGQQWNLLALPGRPSKILLDFGDAPFIASAHFKGKLINLRKRILDDGGFLKLSNLHPLVREGLRTSRMDTIFSIYDSVEEAREAFAGLVLPFTSDGDDGMQSRVDEGVESVRGETTVPDAHCGPQGVAAESIQPDCNRLGNVIIVRPKGSVLGSWDGSDSRTPETLVLSDLLQRLIAETECDVVLDLSSLQGMRNFTGTILAARTPMIPQGRRLVLCLAPSLRQAFRITKLDQAFPCFTELEAAMAWLAEPVRPGSAGGGPPRRGGD